MSLRQNGSNKPRTLSFFEDLAKNPQRAGGNSLIFEPLDTATKF
ncbi:hypothetical protein [Pedosphaera parvula]|uniref:Uncharacterized protein n=1 Tax=Pedosphaera parvula (strain Ellin514) TaxID=320771 RepID=B9XR50_PEDPL|nr:hypothetical protein [Pedosphaera parvula]EEF57663.1 hypothetical protein Cflav_PD0698 [Pedosphaera parvula Ellin514]